MFFFGTGKLDIAMVDGRGQDKTSFVIGLVLLGFAIFFLLGPLILSGVTGVARTEPRFELA